MLTLKLNAVTAALCMVAFYFSAGQSANAFTHAVAVTIDDDGSPFILDSSGSVWGYLQPDNLNEPVKLPGLANVKQIVPFAALTQGGHVFTWDHDSPACCPACSPRTAPSDGYDNGGGPVDRVLKYSLPREVPDLNDVVSLAGDSRHFLALRGDGTVVEFGVKLSVEIDEGFLPDPCAALPPEDIMPRPELISTIHNAIAISTDDDSNYVLEKNGSLDMWGGSELYAAQKRRMKSIDWQYIEKKFIGMDKVTLSTGRFLVALSRKGKAYYWGTCYSRNFNKDDILDGATNNISDIKKIAVNAGGGHLDAYILSDGKIILDSAPFPASADRNCTSSVITSERPPITLRQVPVSAVDVAFPAGSPDADDCWILIVGVDGSLWKILNSPQAGGLSDLTAINLP